MQDNTFSGALTLTTDFLDEHKANTPLAELSRQDIWCLSELCLTSDNILSGGKLFNQRTGIQMGNNLSCACAIIFMDYIEQQVISKLGDRVKLWKRYVDDVFVIFDDITIEELLVECNDVHPNISFTIEEPKNSSIPFLDLKLFKCNGYFSFELYCKPTHSGAVIPCLEITTSPLSSCEYSPQGIKKSNQERIRTLGD